MSSDSVNLRQMIEESGRLAKPQGLARVLEALVLCERGEFLEGLRSNWAMEYGEEFATLAMQARLDAAEWAFDLGRYRQADTLVEAVLQRDPYRERAWRLRMKLLGAIGDGDALISCYQRCVEALASVGLEPAPSTRQLVDHLRR